MGRTFIGSNNMISALGWDTRENLEAMLAGKEGIRASGNRRLSPVDLPLSLLDWEGIGRRFGSEGNQEIHTRFEQLVILSVRDVLEQSGIDPLDSRTILILSTTKGNVELLENAGGFTRDRLQLWRSADMIARHFGMSARPVVVSNACISGVVGMLVARQLILSGQFRHAIVAGADVVSRFAVSGFQSFLSLSDKPCRPFDKDRNGLTLGEAVGTVVISGEQGEIELVGGATSNDANHISGPSRTGEGLFLAMQEVLMGEDEPDLVSAHGTATPYNDEMEAIALFRAGLGEVPVNSLKGFIGHTLGAAGVVETIMNLEAMKQGFLIPTRGFSAMGVSRPVNVVERVTRKQVQTMLKVASGFGGCNAAALFRIR
jgi:3-oxoacyl-[acyl-carrier-protein] synthase-1